MREAGCTTCRTDDKWTDVPAKRTQSQTMPIFLGLWIAILTECRIHNPLCLEMDLDGVVAKSSPVRGPCAPNAGAETSPLSAPLDSIRHHDDRVTRTSCGSGGASRAGRGSTGHPPPGPVTPASSASLGGSVGAPRPRSLGRVRCLFGAWPAPPAAPLCKANGGGGSEPGSASPVRVAPRTARRVGPPPRRPFALATTSTRSRRRRAHREDTHVREQTSTVRPSSTTKTTA